MSEKTEKATSYKLQKFKEQGKVSKSIELNTCIYLLIMLTVTTALSKSALLQIKVWVVALLNTNTQISFNIATIIKLQSLLLSKLTLLWLPLALAGALSIIISTIAQTGFVWSFKPLAPDFKRLNLTEGYKRLCSSKMLFDACKQVIKLGIVTLLLGLSLRHELTSVLDTMKTIPRNLPPLVMSLLTKILLQLLCVLFVIAIIDKLYTRWKFAKDTRMSKQELKDEYRQREGDPKIKIKIKQLQHLQRQKTASLHSIKTADVVIIHRSHLAVVLQYNRNDMPAPKMVCKAQGEMVKQVKLIANQHRIPIIENISLAQKLYTSSDLNQWIKPEHYPLVAMIFRDLFTGQQ